MSTMEFEDLQKIWNTQNQQPMYALNEQALHNRIKAKKNTSGRISHFSELFLMGSNIAAALIVMISILIKDHGNIYSWLLIGLMILTAGYVWMGRVQRRKRAQSFDQSMLGELEHAISDASFQVRLSGIMRWYVLPAGLLIILSVWKNESPVWGLLLIALFFGFTWFAGKWEHGIYVRKRKELVKLKEKLVGG